MADYSDCDVLLLAAGFGKRLQPLTLERPKPLIEVKGRTLIDWNLEMIRRSGYGRVFINLHYLGDQIENFVGDGSRWGLRVEYSFEDVILDTGGAIKNIEHRLESRDLITVNSDILIGPEFRLSDLVEAHRQSKLMPQVTALLQTDADSRTFGELGVTREGQIVTFLGEEFGYGTPARFLHYTGIQVLRRSVLEKMPPPGSVFSVTRDTWRSLLSAREPILGVEHKGYWNDVGTLERLQQAEQEFPGARPPQAK